MTWPPCDSCEARPAQVELETGKGVLRLCGGCFLRVKDPRGWSVINERSE